MKHSKTRLESFSDAVFAFAATLLVVSLEIPESFDGLRQNMISFLGFGISFFVLVMLWKTHYNFFRRHTVLDNWVIAMNMILLFVILFYVYPMKFLVNLTTRQSHIVSPDQLSSIFIWYGVGFSLIFLMISLMYFYVALARHGQENRDDLRFQGRHFGIFVVTAIVSVIVASLNIGMRFGAPGFIYALLGPLCWWHGVRYEKKKTAQISSVAE